MKRFLNLQTFATYLSHPGAWITLGLLPCLFVLLYTVFAFKQLDQQEEQGHYLHAKAAQVSEKQNQEERLLQQLKKADPEYVTNTLETLCFLAEEVKRLQALSLSDPDSALASRLKTLEENHLHFKQASAVQVNQWQEVELTQQHPVEMNEEDLKLLLSRLEQMPTKGKTPPQGAPYLIIEDFELVRKPLSSSEENYQIHLKLLKREPAHE